MKEHCAVCGYLMKTDSFNGKTVCTYCGNDFALPEDSVPGTFADAKDLAKEGRFDEAIRIINGTEKPGPQHGLLKLLCCYRTKSSKELLKKISSDQTAVKMFADREDVDKLAKLLSGRKNKLIIHMLEYCTLALRLSGTDMQAFRHKIKPAVPKNKPQSAFAKMDAEEVYNEERTRRIKEAAHPPVKNLDELLTDYLDTPPEHVYDNEWSKPVDTLAGNIVLDILDLFASDTDYYNPALLSHTRQYRAQLKEQEKKPAPRTPGEALDDEENDSMSETDIILRQKELMELIEEEEFSILNTK